MLRYEENAILLKKQSMDIYGKPTYSTDPADIISFRLRKVGSQSHTVVDGQKLLSFDLSFFTEYEGIEAGDILILKESTTIEATDTKYLIEGNIRIFQMTQKKVFRINASKTK